MLTANVIWLLIAVINSGGITVVERFTDKAECQQVAVQLESQVNGGSGWGSSVRARCIEVNPRKMAREQ